MARWSLTAWCAALGCIGGCWLVAGTDDFGDEPAEQTSASTTADGSATASTATGTTAGTGGSGSGGQASGGEGGTVQPVDCMTAHVVFVTSGVVPVSMNLNGFDSVLEADQKCNETWSATHPGDNLTFVAWLSTTAKHAIDRLPQGVAWCFANGAPVFSSTAAIPSGPIVPVNVNESGMTVISATFTQVWTGTLSNGQLTTPNCSDWTDNGAMGIVGDMNAQSTWTNDGTRDCSMSARLYCFEWP